MLCSQTMCQPKLFLCTSTIVINSKSRGPLKEYQSLCSIVYKCLSVLIPKIMEELSLSHWVEYQCNTSIETIIGIMMVNPVSSLSGQYVNGEGTLCTFQD